MAIHSFERFGDAIISDNGRMGEAASRARQLEQSSAGTTLAAAIVAIAVGWLIARDTAIAGMLVVILALVGCILRRPALVLVVALVAGGVFAEQAAQPAIAVFLPVPSLPLLDTLLLCAGAITAVAILGSRAQSDRLALVHVTAPAAAYGFLSFLFFNQSDLVSGVAEAAVFAYPLLAALLLGADRHTLSFFRKDRYWLNFVGVLAVTIVGYGVWNMVTGVGVETSSGQFRYLKSSASGPLAATVFGGIYLLGTQNRRALGPALVIFGSGGLLLVNHRSAYVALALSICVVLVVSRVRGEFGRNGPRGPLAAIVTGAGAVALLLTPVGHAGLDRLGSVFDTSDPNVRFRLESTRSAFNASTVSTTVFGRGVGLRQRPLGSGMTSTDLPVHNSYVSVFDRGGLIGLGVLLLPIGYAMKVMWRGRRNPKVVALLGLSVFMAIMAASNVVLENSYFGLWFWAPLFAGVMLARSGTGSRSSELSG